jgi:hypothetical protein
MRLATSWVTSIPRPRRSPRRRILILQYGHDCQPHQQVFSTIEHLLDSGFASFCPENLFSPQREWVWVVVSDSVIEAVRVARRPHAFDFDSVSSE